MVNYSQVKVIIIAQMFKRLPHFLLLLPSTENSFGTEASRKWTQGYKRAPSATNNINRLS